MYNHLSSLIINNEHEERLFSCICDQFQIFLQQTINEISIYYDISKLEASKICFNFDSKILIEQTLESFRVFIEDSCQYLTECSPASTWNIKTNSCGISHIECLEFISKNSTGTDANRIVIDYFKMRSQFENYIKKTFI